MQANRLCEMCGAQHVTRIQSVAETGRSDLTIYLASEGGWASLIHETNL